MAPARRPHGAPFVVIDPAPAYELLESLLPVIEGDRDDTYDVGPEWVADLRARAGDALIARIREVCFDNADLFTSLVTLAYETPAPRDVPAFLEHLRETDPVELKLHLVSFYTREARRMTPLSVMRAAVAGDRAARDEFLRTSHPEVEEWTHFLANILDADGDELKAGILEVLAEWHEKVWKAEALTILPIIERDAAAKRAMLTAMPIDEFVREATNGVEYVPRPGVARIVMVPSFVQRPLVSYTEYADVQLIVYPVADESVTAATDEPPRRLVRLSKALGDEKRLRILRALADGEKTLMELADMFGVAKTTMHHHMIILRSAGLVTVGVGQKRYRLRQEALPDVGGLLAGYLGAPAASATPASPAAPKRRTTAGR
ncbi:MAG TPA: metalloregulator ArsR/SmtB family transcription factor [Candidatus Limnocylindria bacterium]|nr:metalloregulator ArsR/SmtB family transcription factor [Candidatus Limnocylindria bacterium]